MKPDAIFCEGCSRSLNTHWSPECVVMLCALSKGNAYCFQCSDFVCEKLEASPATLWITTVGQLRT